MSNIADDISMAYSDGFDDGYKQGQKDAQERKTGHWVGARQYCRHLEEVTGEKYSPSGIGNMIYCDQCWKASDRKSNYCPDCGSYNGGQP